MKKYQDYVKWKKEIQSAKWFPFADCFLCFVMSVITVLPMLWKLIREVPFSYEMNDDAVLVQILNGSFTGTPDPHAIHVKEPLTLLMTWFYEKNPSFELFGTEFSDVNWYVGVVVILDTIALVAVLFRILTFFKCNRILICILYWFATLIIWGPCFSNMTFTTAAAFLSCMALLFFGFSEWKVLWRPWNGVIFAGLCVAGWCLRASCFYMVVPFLGVEFLFKFHYHLFRSWRPWVFVAIVAVILAGSYQVNQKAYSSKDWQKYLTYNRERAYLQDYGRFPDYDEEKPFYDRIGVDRAEYEALSHYSYCMVDGFKPRTIHKIYKHVKSQEKDEFSDYVIRGSSLNTTYIKGLIKHLQRFERKAYRMVYRSKQAHWHFREASIVVWLLLGIWIWVAMTLLNKKRLPVFLAALVQTVIFAALLKLEWEYLAMNGRFPERVEESMRLTMLCAGIVMTGHFADLTKHSFVMRMPWILQLQILIIALTISGGALGIWFQDYTDELAASQTKRITATSEKRQALEYCGKHPENRYVLYTMSFTRASTPYDEFHQGNWMMSGSWSAYSPLYYEKLKQWKTRDLASKFLLRDRVYVITKGKKNLGAVMGCQESERVQAEIVDEYKAKTGVMFYIYKVLSVEEPESR